MTGELLLGVDGGATKTLAVVAQRDGAVRGVGRGACANFQVTGRVAAREEIARAVSEALADAEAPPEALAGACFGLSGADRPVDFETCSSLIEGLAGGAPARLMNDTTVALRAGTPDGVGIALIAGTGSNSIGVNRAGRLHKVGGMDRLLGDFGGARDIAERAVGLAQRGRDGRGALTALYERFVTHLGLTELIDLCEDGFFDAPSHHHLPALCPIVFEVAAHGDPVAIELLEGAGREAARCANVLLHALFTPDEAVTIVLGGSLYQRGRSPVMMRALEQGLDPAYGALHLERLTVEPVLGAVLAAADAVTGAPASEPWAASLATSFEARLAGSPG